MDIANPHYLQLYIDKISKIFRINFKENHSDVLHHSNSRVKLLKCEGAFFIYIGLYEPFSSYPNIRYSKFISLQ